MKKTTLHHEIYCEKAFRLLGQPRCGQHAIINWIFSQSAGEGIWLNNCSRGHTEYDLGKYKDGVHYFGKHFGGKGCAEDETTHLLGFGYEGPADREDNNNLPSIYVIRDLYNHMASVEAHQALQIDANTFFQSVEGYFLKYQNPSDNEVVVDFPRWSCDLKYREELWGGITTLLDEDWAFTDSGRGDVKGGGGSSFDRPAQGDASKMEVLHRYKLVDLGKYSESIPNNLKLINNKIFGWVYEKNV